MERNAARLKRGHSQGVGSLILEVRLIKVAARVVETARTVRLGLSACYPEAAQLASLPAAIAALGP